MRKLSVFLLLAGAMGGAGIASAEDPGVTTAVEVSPTVELVSAPEVDAAAEVTLIAELPPEGATETVAETPLDPMPIGKEVLDPAADADTPKSDEGMADVDGDGIVDEEQVLTFGDGPADSGVVVGPQPGEMEDGMVYITGAPGGDAAGSNARSGVDEDVTPVQAVRANRLPAPMGVMERGSAPR